ncbi:hypothetical protein DYB37_013409 [Aphanomyces astaci]|uniref:Amidase domain-containing protein n=1 Tax=Aphanomyces astaci TaxID=112090 RepID=A0A3R6Z5C0_APHAT|nr:hypothetical protein DYB37_013409 [Aphanomyces astaci]
MRIVLPFVLASAFQAALSRAPDTFNYTETTIDKLQDAIVSQQLSVKEIVQHYLDVIDQLNHKGPQLNGVIETSPTALAQAATQDLFGNQSTLLHGIPILIKDNIATTGDGLTACAGSFAMEGNIAPRDAFLVQKLRAAGAIVLGHANMVEWANWRSVTDSVDWRYHPPLLTMFQTNSSRSARGGITKNPYVLTAPTTGSSSGPALTVAANMIPVAIGTESGLPMGRTVADVARVLQAIAGFDPKDRASKDAPVPEYSQTYNALTSLKNVRVAISKQANTDTRNDYLSPAQVNAFNKGVETLENLGADIVYAPYPNAAAISKSQCDSLMLESLNSPNKTNSTYLDALALCQDLAVTNGIEKYIKDTQADVIFALTLTWSLAPSSPGYHSIAGWPILSVPLGYDHSVPFGVSFVTPKYQEEKLLQYGYLFEQATKARVAPQFLPDN